MKPFNIIFNQYLMNPVIDNLYAERKKNSIESTFILINFLLEK